MKISEVSEVYGLSSDTLRYYEKIGLLKDIPRNKSGIRDYDENSCQKIAFIKCMREAGVEIDALIKYFLLFDEGKKTITARKELLINQRDKLVKKQKNISDTLEKLNYKIHIYDEIEQGKRKDFSED